jgi:hypothetical protein
MACCPRFRAFLALLDFLLLPVFLPVVAETLFDFDLGGVVA